MNADKDLLELEIRLLIARHGKPRVSEALSSIEADLPTLDTDVKDYASKSRKRRARPRHKKDIDEMIREVHPDNPDVERLVRKLALAYEQKEFLPELRRVKSFLESRGALDKKIRSRADALPAVILVLARSGLDELTALAEKKSTRDSDLGIIANHILGSGDSSGGIENPPESLPHR